MNFVSCAQALCPNAVKKDCGRWLTDLEAATPTIVVEACDVAGQETSAVRVLEGDDEIAATLTGVALAVDPGEHTLRFVLHDGAAREEHFVFREGEQRRRVSVSFGAAPCGSPRLSPLAAPAADQTRAPQTGPLRQEVRPALPAPHSIPAPAFALGGLAVLGGATFGVFGALGLSAETEAASRCGPRCTPNELAPIRRDYLVGDIALGVGLVALVAAVVIAWPRSARRAVLDTPFVTTRPTASGAQISSHETF